MMATTRVAAQILTNLSRALARQQSIFRVMSSSSSSCSRGASSEGFAEGGPAAPAAAAKDDPDEPEKEEQPQAGDDDKRRRPSSSSNNDASPPVAKRPKRTPRTPAWYRDDDEALESIYEKNKRRQKLLVANNNNSLEPKRKMLTPDPQWDEMFAQLMSFRCEHGHVHVPQDKTSRLESQQLSCWVRAQRQAFKKYRLRPDHLQRLQRVKFAFAFQQGTRCHKAAYADGGSDPQYKGYEYAIPIEEEEIIAGAAKDGKVEGNDDDALSFHGEDEAGNYSKNSSNSKVLQPDPKWDEMFGLLMEFRRKHGHVHVPQDNRKASQLGQWVRAQRQKYKQYRLRPDHLARLEQVQFAFALRRGNGFYHCPIQIAGGSDPRYKGYAFEIPRVEVDEIVRDGGVASNDDDDDGGGGDKDESAIEETVGGAKDVADEAGDSEDDDEMPEEASDGKVDEEMPEEASDGKGDENDNDTVTFHGKMEEEEEDKVDDYVEDSSTSACGDKTMLEPDSNWDKMFRRLLMYRREHGHVHVPLRYNGGQKPSLGIWVKSQRQKYRRYKLRPDHLARLEQIDFAFALDDTRRPIKVDGGSDPQLYGFTYKLPNVEKEAGDGCCDDDDDEENDGEEVAPTMGGDARTGNGANNARQALEPDFEWNSMFVRLLAYRREQGHAHVPQTHGSNCMAIRSLSLWVKCQRKKYREYRMRPDHIIRLEQIGFAFAIDSSGTPIVATGGSDPKYNGYAYEVPIAEELAGEEVQESTTEDAVVGKIDDDDDEEASKNESEENETPKQGDHDDDREEAHVALALDPKWEANFAELLAYKREHGNAYAPTSGHTLSSWISQQRSSFRRYKMRPDHLERLKGIGFAFAMSTGKAANPIVVDGGSDPKFERSQNDYARQATAAAKRTSETQRTLGKETIFQFDSTPLSNSTAASEVEMSTDTFKRSVQRHNTSLMEEAPAIKRAATMGKASISAFTTLRGTDDDDVPPSNSNFTNGDGDSEAVHIDGEDLDNANSFTTRHSVVSGPVHHERTPVLLTKVQQFFPSRTICASEYANLDALLAQLHRNPLIAEYACKPFKQQYPKYGEAHDRIVADLIDLDIVSRRIKAREYDSSRAVLDALCRVFDQHLDVFAQSQEVATRQPAFIMAHLKDYVLMLWQEYMLPSDPPSGPSQSDPATLMFVERDVNRKLRMANSGRRPFTLAIFRYVCHKVDGLMASGGLVDGMDYEHLSVLGRGSDLEAALNELSLSLHDLSESDEEVPGYDMETFLEDLLDCVSKSCLKYRQVNNRLCRFFWQIMTPLHEANTRGMFSSSIWGDALHPSWAREHGRRPFWPALCLGVLSPEVEDWHAIVTERNESRLPKETLALLLQSRKMCQKSIQARRGFTFYLVEFMGIHEFAWIHARHMLPFDAANNPNDSNRWSDDDRLEELLPRAIQELDAAAAQYTGAIATCFG